MTIATKTVNIYKSIFVSVDIIDILNVTLFLYLKVKFITVREISGNYETQICNVDVNPKINEFLP